MFVVSVCLVAVVIAAKVSVQGLTELLNQNVEPPLSATYLCGSQQSYCLQQCCKKCSLVVPFYLEIGCTSLQRGEVECCLHGPQSIQEKNIAMEQVVWTFQITLVKAGLSSCSLSKYEVIEGAVCNLVKKLKKLLGY